MIYRTEIQYRGRRMRFRVRANHMEWILPLAAFFLPFVVKFGWHFTDGCASFALKHLPSFKSAISAGLVTANQVGLFELFLLTFLTASTLATYRFAPRLSWNMIQRRKKSAKEAPTSSQMEFVFFLILLMLFISCVMPYRSTLEERNLYGSSKYVVLIMSGMTLSSWFLTYSLIIAWVGKRSRSCSKPLQPPQ